MTEKTIASKKCTIFPDENATVCLVQPVDERESALLEKQVGEIKRLTDKPFVMAAFLIEDWNRELSPWEAPAVFGKENFGSGATETHVYHRNPDAVYQSKIQRNN